MSGTDSKLAGISKTVILLGVVSFLTDVSSESIYPLIPLYLTDVLKAQVHNVGLIEGIAESTASVVRVFSGWLSDRVGNRKWLTVAGYAISMLSKPLLSLTGSWEQVLGTRFADRLGKGVRTAPRDALIADVAAIERRGVSFGLHRAMDSLGATAGPLIAFFVILAGAIDYRKLFLLAAIPAAAGVLILIAFIREPAWRHRTEVGLPSLRLHGFSRSFKTFLFITTLFAVGNSSDVFLILRARDVGVGVSSILLIYVFFNSVDALLATGAGALSDRMGRRNVVMAGYVVFAVVYAGFGLAGRPATIWVLFAVYGMYNALTHGVQKSFAADLMPADARGMGMGAYTMLTGLALFPASLIAGYLWDAFGPAAPFYYGAATGVISAVLLAAFFGRSVTCTDT